MTSTVSPEPPTTSEASAFYVTGGTLSASALSYVERRADRDLLGGLTAGDYCYVLNSRQMGKSSLCVRTMARLKALGHRTCFLDLTKFGGKNLSAEQWYAALLSEAGRELGLRSEMLAFWKANTELGPMQRFFGALQQVALPAAESPLTVFVDEIDVTRGLPFSADEFFAGVRQCYVGRTTDPALNRLTVCLLGTATPADLIQDTRTSPFNIGRRIEVRDFTPDEAQPLAVGLGTNGPHLLSRLLYWTGGHPYLTQRLCRAAQETGAKTEGEVDQLCSGLFLTRTAAEADDNLAFVRNRLLKSEVDLAGLLDLYGQMRRGRRVPDDEADPLCAVLKLSGVARTEGGALHVRNRIYEHVFSREWIIEHTPGAELRRQKEAYRRGLVRAGAVAAGVVLVMGLLVLSAFQNARRANVNAARWKAAQAVSDQNLYMADMSLIQQAWEGGNFRHALVLLQQTRGLPGRSFEWGYWNRLCHPRETVLNPPLAAGDTLTDVTSDASRFFIVGKDGTASVRDAATGHELFTLREHGGANTSGGFLPDSSRIILFGKDGTAQLRDARTGRELFTLPGRFKQVSQIAVSQDSRRIAIFADKATRVWDAQDGHLVLTLKGPANGGVTAVALSPEGGRLVTSSLERTTSSNDISGATYTTKGGATYTTKVWDTTDGRELITLKGSDNFWSAAAFSPDGTRIVTGNSVGTAKVWDATNGQELLTFKGHLGVILAAAFSPDGKRIITTSDDGNVMVWDAQDGRELRTLLGYTGRVLSAAFSADGRYVITSGDDNTARIWDTQDNVGPLTLHTHSPEIAQARFSPDGRYIVTAGQDNAACVWDAQTGRVLLTFMGHTAPVNSAAFSPDEKRIITFSWGDQMTRIWDVETGRERLKLRGAFGAFSPDGQRIITGSLDDRVRVWDAETGRERLKLRGAFGAFSPDGKRILVIRAERWSSPDCTVLICDARNGQPLLTFHERNLTNARFSPDGGHIVAKSLDGTVRVLDAGAGREILAFQWPRGTDNPVYSPDGKRIVTANSVNGAASVWDAQTGRLLLTLPLTAGGLYSAFFSPDGTRIVTAGEDGTVRVWKTDFTDYKDQP